jgi:hypothetical protein
LRIDDRINEQHDIKSITVSGNIEFCDDCGPILQDGFRIKSLNIAEHPFTLLADLNYVAII